MTAPRKTPQSGYLYDEEAQSEAIASESSIPPRSPSGGSDEELGKLLDNMELASANRAIVRLRGSTDEVLHEDIPVIAARSAIESYVSRLRDERLTPEEAQAILDTNVALGPVIRAKLRLLSTSDSEQK